MEYNVFQTQLYERISSMSFNDRTRLAIETCKRLLPDYVSFHQAHRWGDPDRLRDGIRACEEWLTGVGDSVKTGELLQRVDAVTPDTDDFGDFDGSFALNASAAVASALKHLVDRDFEHIMGIAMLYTDTIDFKLHGSGIQDEEIGLHPMMTEARRFLLGERS
jgi:uncharacterized protein YjaG (DUF416 family)